MNVENLENKRKMLIFRADHRGMREMDLLLGSFAKKYVPDFTSKEVDVFEELLKENDPDLYNWMTGKEEAPEHVRSSVFDKLYAHKFC